MKKLTRFLVLGVGAIVSKIPGAMAQWVLSIPLDATIGFDRITIMMMCDFL
ncbi:MAG: hypothetical protein GDA43_04095 [Hormoscilla sp. SP5CHS1]|nr:hypothetical protein [Hormoscilla sp. SP12CHS1]MBC6452473.1 hypothetical protein [Hormoscilla sp. SP5CHS1]